MKPRASAQVVVVLALTSVPLLLASAPASASGPIPSSDATPGSGSGLPHAMAATTSPEMGGQVWAARFNGLGNGSDSPTAVRVSPDGSRVYVTGSSWDGPPTQGGNGTDFATIAYGSESGHALWVRRYNGPADGADEATGEAVATGRVYVTGWSTGADSGKDFETIAYTSTGGFLWAQRFNGPGNGDDEASAIAVSSDGSRIFVSGSVTQADQTQSSETLAYGSDGTPLWSALTPGSVMAVSPDGSRLYVAGSTGGGFQTAAYDASTGEKVWTETHDADFEQAGPSAIAVTPDGSRVSITGGGCTECEEGFEESGITFTYASNGSLLWSKEDDGGGGCGCVEESTLSMSPNGSTAYVGGGIFNCYLLFAYNDATGALRWSRSSRGPCGQGQGVSAVAAGPGGKNVFIVGQLHGAYETAKYTSSGQLGWARTYSGPTSGADNPTSIAVNPAGTRVYVTGTSPGVRSKNDYATVAYTTA